jgi:hypothetical protein
MTQYISMEIHPHVFSRIISFAFLSWFSNTKLSFFISIIKPYRITYCITHHTNCSLAWADLKGVVRVRSLKFTKHSYVIQHLIYQNTGMVVIRETCEVSGRGLAMTPY